MDNIALNKNDWKLKLDAAHKVTAVTNQRLEELKSHTLKKENEVQQLQDQVRQLTKTLERVNKVPYVNLAQH